MSHQYGDTNCGLGMVYDTPEEKEIERLNKTIRTLRDDYARVAAERDSQQRVCIKAMTENEALRAALAERQAASVADVIAERTRQIEREGWTPEHDDAHKAGELAMAGAAYAMHHYSDRPMTWPWDWSWWKPTNERRNLVKAAALILAEIDRMDRARATKEG